MKASVQSLRPDPVFERPDAISLREFVRAFWHVNEQRPYQSGWATDAMCEFLEAVTKREIMQGVIEVPPRRSKSTTVSVMWPAWVWGEQMGPHGAAEQFFYSSYGDSIVKRDSFRCRNILEHDQYRQRYPHLHLVKGQNQTHYYLNTLRGYRDCSTVGGQGTGKGGDVLIFDDPMSAEQVLHAGQRAACHHYWSSTLSTRYNEFASTVQLIIAHRLHTKDLNGHVREGEAEGWTFLRIPNEYDPLKKCIIIVGRTENGRRVLENLKPETAAYTLLEDDYDTLAGHHKQATVFFEDPREEPGELMDPDRFPKAERKRMKRRLGSAYNAQYNQDPDENADAVFKPWWWRFWYPAGAGVPLPWTTLRLDDEGNTTGVHEHKQVEVPDRFDITVQAWDMAFKKTTTSSRVAGQVWSRKTADLFLRDSISEHLGILGSINGIRNFDTRYPEISEVLIEDAANGPAIMEMLEGEIPGIIAMPTAGGKEGRANATVGYVEAGNVYLPHPAVFPWVVSFISAMKQIPSDEMDAAVHAMIRLQKARERWFSA